MIKFYTFLTVFPAADGVQTGYNSMGVQTGYNSMGVQTGYNSMGVQTGYNSMRRSRRDAVRQRSGQGLEAAG